MIQWDTPFTTFMTIHSIVVNVVLVRMLLLRNRGNTVQWLAMKLYDATIAIRTYQEGPRFKHIETVFAQ